MIPQAEFHKALKVAASFIDPSLPGLHVVHFNFLNPENFEMVTTDGHTLVNIEFSTPHSCPPGARVSVPLPMAKDLLKLFPAGDDTEVTLAYWDSKLLITNGVNTHTVQGPPPAEYPDYPQVIAAVSPVVPGVAGFNPKLLAAILKNCAPLIASKGADSPRVDIGVSAGEVPLRMEFRVDPALATISALTAYLMPLGADGRVT